MNTKDFSFKIIDTRDVALLPSNEARALYSMWENVWLEALAEVDGVRQIASDEFSRHHYLGVIFYQGEPIGSVSFSRFDLSLEMSRRDSYFKPWPEELLQALGRDYPGRNVLVGCSFTLKREWRRDAAGFSAKRLLMALVVEHFLHVPETIMVGTMRVNRGMHTICYELGARALESGVEAHGLPADLIAFEGKENLRAMTDQVAYRREAAEIYQRGIEANASISKVMKKSA